MLYNAPKFYEVAKRIIEITEGCILVAHNAQFDNRILTTIIDKFKGGPVGLTTISTAVGEQAGTIEEVYEPYLIMEGYLMRTPRGRQVTELAYRHLGKVKPLDQGNLF